MARGHLLVATLITAYLAGCTTTTDEHGDHDHEITADTFRIKVTGAPAHVESGQAATFTVIAESVDDGHTTTTHMGAHHWAASTDDPNGDFSLAGSCSHTQGEMEVPGSIEVTCSGLEDGTHFLRGHLRVSVDDQQINYWSDEFSIHVGPMS